MLYTVNPISPGSLWWEGLGHNRHVLDLSTPIRTFSRPGTAVKVCSEACE